MLLTERDLSRLSRSVIAEQKLNDLIHEARLSSSGINKLLNTPKGQRLERKAQEKATTLLQRTEGSMRTVGDLKRAIAAALSKRADKRESGTFWASIGGTIGSLIYPLLSLAGQTIPALSALAGPYGLIASTVGGGMVSMLTNIMLQRNAVRGTALADFAVNPRILNAVPDHIEGEFIQYMASVLQNSPDNAPLKDFDMTKELLYFMKDKYGLDIKDLTQKDQALAAGFSRAGNEMLAERKGNLEQAKAIMKKRKNQLRAGMWFLNDYLENRGSEAREHYIDVMQAIVTEYNTGARTRPKPTGGGSRSKVEFVLKKAKSVFLKTAVDSPSDFVSGLNEGLELIRKFKRPKKRKAKITSYSYESKNVRGLASQVAANVMMADDREMKKAKADAKAAIEAAYKAKKITDQEMKKIKKILKSGKSDIQKYGDIAGMLQKA